jgi:hypothetical protein
MATVGLEIAMTDKIFLKLITFTAALILNGAIIAGVSYLFDAEMQQQATGAAVCDSGQLCSRVRHDSSRLAMQ